MRRPHAARTRFGGSETMIPTLETLLERGAQAAPAVKLAADKRTVYNLTLALEGIEGPPGIEGGFPGLHGLQGPLRVKVSPEHRGNVTSIKLDVVDETFPLSVTALFNARLDARDAAPSSMPRDHYENVLRIIEARAGSGEVVVFVSGARPAWHPEAGIITATRLIAVKLVELGLASERTLTVVRITNYNTEFPDLGTPMYGGSDVLVGTIGRIVIAAEQPTYEAKDKVLHEHIARLHLRLLFEGGAWAVQKDDGNYSRELPIAVPPGDRNLSISVRTSRHRQGTHACILVHITTDVYQTKSLLLVVHDALQNAEPMLRQIDWLPGLDVDKTMALMRRHVKNSSEMVIFALSSDASQRGRVQRVMRALYDLGLAAQQPHKDAHVVLCHGDGSGVQIEAASLLSLIRDKRADLRQREIGFPLTPKRPKKPKLGDGGTPVGSLPERADAPCAVS